MSSEYRIDGGHEARKSPSLSSGQSLDRKTNLDFPKKSSIGFAVPGARAGEIGRLRVPSGSITTPSGRSVRRWSSRQFLGDASTKLLTVRVQLVCQWLYNEQLFTPACSKFVSSPTHLPKCYRETMPNSVPEVEEILIPSGIYVRLALLIPRHRLAIAILISPSNQIPVSALVFVFSRRRCHDGYWTRDGSHLDRAITCSGVFRVCWATVLSHHDL
jgi:hypothetical protein